MTRRGPRNLTLRCALAALLLYGGAAMADVHRFDLRDQFIRERDPELRPPGLDVQPRIDSALLFVGNINLAENSEDEVDVAGIELAPGIFASYRSARADATLDYSFIGRAFEEDDYDSASHLLSAHGQLHGRAGRVLHRCAGRLQRFDHRPRDQHQLRRHGALQPRQRHGDGQRLDHAQT